MSIKKLAGYCYVLELSHLTAFKPFIIVLLVTFVKTINVVRVILQNLTIMSPKYSLYWS